MLGADVIRCGQTGRPAAHDAHVIQRLPGGGAQPERPGVSPFEVRAERRAELGVVGKPGGAGGGGQQLDPPCAVRLVNVLAEVLGEHPRVSAVGAAVLFRASEHFSQLRRDMLRVLG
jgi:hypothetical protein